MEQNRHYHDEDNYEKNEQEIATRSCCHLRGRQLTEMRYLNYIKTSQINSHFKQQQNSHLWAENESDCVNIIHDCVI